MRAVVLEDFGGPETLTVKEIDVPQPGEGEILIKAAYCSVNPVDWKICQGYLKHMFTDWAFPLIPGWDVSGVVEAVGPGVENFAVGDEVMAYCKGTRVQWGTYAEFVCCPANKAAPKPQNLSMAQAAAIPLVSLTSWQIIHDYCKLQAGQVILIHAGAGGVGSIAIQLAKQVGAKVYTTASAENHPYVLELGADVAIDYRKEDFVERMGEMEPDGVDVVLDAVGGEVLMRSYPLVKPGGYIPTIAAAHDKELLQELEINGICLVVRPNGEQLAMIGQLFEEGKLVPPEVHELLLEEASEAHRRSKEGHTRGKIVLKVS